LPSAETVIREGMSVGEMNHVLLRQIEEMTLHMIDMKEEQDALNETVRELKQELDVLKGEQEVAE